jgi:hypothetical protein
MTAQMLTVAQVADLRRMTPNGLASERYRRQGPPYVRSGHRTVLYPADQFEAWLAAHTHKP